MRIAHVANFYGPSSGGLRTAMHELGHGYLDRGHDYLMVVPGADDVDEATVFGRRVTVESPVLLGTGGYRLITRTARVREVLAGFSPDVLEVSDRTSLRSLGTWAREQGVPSTFFAHERADGVLAANLPRRLGRSRLAAAAVDAHNRGTARRFSSVVATTEFAAQEFTRIGVTPRLVPLGVDLDRFHPGRHDARLRDEMARPDETLLLMASRLSPEKRPEIAIEAVRELVARGRRVRLLCAGGGASQRRVRELAQGLPVEFLGFVRGRDRFSRLLATADAVLAPGPIETFGLAALEALASGTPVVVNTESALPSVVGDGGVAAPGDGRAFADAVETVIDEEPRARRARARQRAESMPWSATVDRMLRLHQHAVGNRTAVADGALTAPGHARA